MRIFTLFIAFTLIGIGALTYTGSVGPGGEPSITAAIPAFVGGGMLLGVLVSLPLRKTGLQLAFIAAVLGAGLGIGRLIPSHLDETLVPGDPFPSRILAMSAVCLVYVLVMSFRFWFRPRPFKKTTRRSDLVEENAKPIPAETTPVEA